MTTKHELLIPAGSYEKAIYALINFHPLLVKISVSLSKQYTMLPSGIETCS